LFAIIVDENSLVVDLDAIDKLIHMFIAAGLIVVAALLMRLWTSQNGLKPEQYAVWQLEHLSSQ
jgi:hypothetical protein